MALHAVFPLRKFYTEQVFILGSMNILKYFKAELAEFQMHYKLVNYWNKYKILSKYE